MESIKETKELILAVNVLSLYLVKVFKDGVQFSDFTDLYSKVMSDEAFKQKMLDAYRGVKEIPAELKDLDAREIIELTSLQLSFLPEIIDQIKK
jgi:hypothetical protein